MHFFTSFFRYKTLKVPVTCYYKWGIKVMRIHPSGVTGTEFKEKASRDGGIQFKSISLGQVSQEKGGTDLGTTSRTASL